MGSVLRFANKTMPHSWFMSDKDSAKLDLGGQLFGAHDRNYRPKEVEPIPQIDMGSESNIERDRMRRTARRAAGRDSTIRTSSQGAPYSSAPKSLLGS